MATVIFTSELQRFTGEETTVVAATTYRNLIEQLLTTYPSLSREQLNEMAVAIDGEIIHDPFLEALRPENEIHFMFKISGG